MPQDTSTAARKAQYDAYRRMKPSERVRLAAQMSEDARRITTAGLRARHPELGEAAIHDALLRTLLGSSLYMKAGLDERG